MLRQTIRSRLPDLDEDGNPVEIDAGPSAARVSREPPPEVRPRSRFAQEKQREKEAAQPLFGGEGFTGAAGERFELNFDDTPPPASMMSAIQERTVSTPTAPSKARPAQSTGFPQVSRRPVIGSNPQVGPKKVSRFKASLAKGKSPADGAFDAKPVPKTESPRTVTIPPANPLHRDIDEENARVIDGMDDAEIEEEQAQLLEMLGPEMVEFLRARNGHSTAQSASPKASASAAVAEPVPALSPSKAGRVRFNEEVQYSNPPSRSPSPVRRNPPIILPSSDDPTIGNWLQDEAARVDRDRESVALGEEEGTPGDIRRRFFPQEPMSASLDWTGENKSGRDEAGESSASTNATSAVRFDLQGKVVEQPASSGYIDHSTEAHRHAGADQNFSLPELMQLAKSAVAGQRTLALQIVDKAASPYLGGEVDGDAGKRASATLITSDAVNEIVGVCARGLADKHVGVVVLSISVLHSFAESTRTRLNATAAVLSVSPSPLHWFARLLAFHEGPDSIGLPRPSLNAILATLCNLLDTQEDFISAEYIETPQLLENVTSLFLRRPWPPSESQGSDAPNPAAAQLLATIISRSRANAEQVIERRLEQGAFRYIAVPPWAIGETDGNVSPTEASRGESGLAFELAGSTLRILSEYANFGLGCSALSSSAPLFRAIERWIGQTGNVLVHEGFSRSWFDLLESWSLCAIDPHSTTPEHDILWAETKDWGEHCLDVLLVEETEGAGLSAALRTVIVRALAAWLEGARRNNKAAFAHVQARLRSEAASALTTAIEDAAGEDGITSEGAQMLLAIKKLVTMADMQDALGEKAALLGRVQVEQAQPPVAVVPQDEGWM